MDPRIVSAAPQEDEAQFEAGLRRLDDFTGQAKLKEKLAMDHVLLYGPPGLGKTTQTSDPILQKKLDPPGA